MNKVRQTCESYDQNSSDESDQNDEFQQSKPIYMCSDINSSRRVSTKQSPCLKFSVNITPCK